MTCTVHLASGREQMLLRQDQVRTALQLQLPELPPAVCIRSDQDPATQHRGRVGHKASIAVPTSPRSAHRDLQRHAAPASSEISPAALQESHPPGCLGSLLGGPRSLAVAC
jgi:hypothetical protein